MQKQITMPRVDVGSQVSYSYEVHLDPLLPKTFFDIRLFNALSYNAKLNNISYTLEVPEDLYVNLAWNLLPDPSIEDRDGVRTYRWDIESIEKAEPELSMPNAYDAYSWVAFSSFKDWDDVGRWYAKLTEGLYGINDEMKSEVGGFAELEPFERMMAVYDFVAENVKYVALGIGLGRYRPHSAGSVYNSLYGDCKDQATLLIALLNYVGIDAYPALLGTSVSFPRFMDKLPSPQWMAHAIVAVPVEGGEYIYLDPTSPTSYYDGMGALPTQDQDCDILIIEHNKTVTSRTPVFKPEDNAQRVVQSFELDKDGTLRGNATLYNTGQYAEQMRQLFKIIEQLGAEQSNLSITPERLLSSTISVLASGANVTDFEVLSDPEKVEKEFVFNVTYVAEGYGRYKNGSLAVEPPLNKLKMTQGGLVQEILKSYMEKMLEEERRYPMMAIPAMSEDVITLKLPQGDVVLPENFSIETRFAVFNCTFERAGNESGEVIIRSTQRTNASVIEPEDYPEYIKFTKAVIEYTPMIEIKGAGNIIDRFMSSVKRIISRLCSFIR